MSFADNINHICAERGANLTSLVKEAKGSGSFTTAINKGSLPKEGEIEKMADLLGCTVADFFSGSATTVSAPGLSDDELDLLRIFRALPRKERHKLLSCAYDLEDAATE